MLPFGLLNWLVPSQPTTDTVSLVHPITPPRKQSPLTGYILVVCTFMVLALVVLIVLFASICDCTPVWIRNKLPQTKQTGKCVLPAYPEHGTYVITKASALKPGDSCDSLKLTVICLNGYGVLGIETVSCLDGSWSDSIPKCVPFCKLDKNPSVHYHCLVPGSFREYRACNAYEPPGTVVRPECNSPDYYSAGILRSMRCIDGSWDYVAVCSPECGRVTPNGQNLLTDGRPAKRGELPWHVGIYRKNTRPYKQVCGGSIISTRLVISAAQCFWSYVSKLLPASQFAVAAGKIYRPWNNPRDVHAQKSDVKQINIPARFHGSAANYQDDIAVLILKIAFVYNSFARPICLSFDFRFDRSQLQPGKLAKVAGWGITAENGKPSQILKVIDLPYVDIEQCIAASPPNFREYITSDKICAGSGNDGNQSGSNVRTAHTNMGQPMAVVLRSTRPWPANFSPSVGTPLMTHTADFADWMLPSWLRNWLVPSQLPTTETVILIPPTTPRRRQGPPTSSITGTAAAFFKLLTVTGWVALSLLLVFVLVYRRAVSFMKWMNEDESDEPGNKQLRTKPVEKTIRPKQSGKCVLPAYPENGKYVITGAPDAKPGDSFESLKLTVSCQNGYGVLGTEIVFCLDGLWSDSIPKCVRFCELDNNTSVHYHCLVTGSIEGSRACNRYEPSGTVVRPECKSPNYYSAGTLPFMRCVDGTWDNVAECSPECGRVTPNGENLIIGGKPAKRGELPWHVGIYRKSTKPYMQICGGSIISTRLVISAAHCFWKDDSKLLPASQFAVAAGKIYRPWNNPRDVHAQKSDVKEIKIPARFQGSETNFQDDLAIVILEADFVYSPFVRPICLSFDFKFDRSQLQPGKMGKVAGWGLTAENGKPSQILKVIDLPYVDIEQCIAASPPNFREYITSDKICAGSGNGKALCRGDSGGGLAFPEKERGTDRYYLRGIVSTAATNENLCNSNTLTTFTQILIHEHFVREYL